MSGEFKFNQLLREIIAEKFNGRQASFARSLNMNRQELHKFYHNKIPLSYKRFRVFADKCGYKLKVEIERI